MADSFTGPKDYKAWRADFYHEWTGVPLETSAQQRFQTRSPSHSQLGQVFDLWKASCVRVRPPDGGLRRQQQRVLRKESQVSMTVR